MTEKYEPVIADLLAGRKSNGRGIYNRDAKRRLVEACLQPGVSVAHMALIHGLNANLLRKWITMQSAKRVPSVRAKSRSPALLPVIAHDVPDKPAAEMSMRAQSDSHIEILIGDCTIRVRGAVDVPQLRTVMDCLLVRRL